MNDQEAYDEIELDESADRTVTSSRRAGTPAAERKRQQRERDRGGALIYERSDWMLFLDATTLPQKAGCQPARLRQVVLREAVDNSLDTGAQVTLRQVEGTWIIADDGPGLSSSDVVRLFAVNRPLASSKLRRLPLRGMLGNGLRTIMGAVAASEGSLTVETRGHFMTLAVDPANGTTVIVDDQPVPFKPGMTVYLTFGPRLPSYSHDDSWMARTAITIAGHGSTYDGPSSPWWYAPRDLYELMQRVTPVDTTVAHLSEDLGFELDDDRICRTLDRDEAAAVLDKLRQGTKPVKPEALGAIGPDLYGDTYCYACRTGFTSERGAQISFVVEAWATCERSEGRGNGSASVQLFLNRTPSTATIHADSEPSRLEIEGCGLHRYVEGPKTGIYQIAISIIVPHIDLAGDGKEPVLAPFSEAIVTVMRKACGAAHRAMEKPPGGMKIKEAAWQVMPDAYRIASSGGTLPATARQTMYAARGEILRLTGKQTLNDQFFTQVLLPDFIEAHPGITADWDIVFDDRGSFVEPHTGCSVPLGTVQVRQYLGERPAPETPASVSAGLMFPTSGPLNRYRDILFVEKEGFSALLAQAQIAERFDVAVMSTKGLSNTAARMLIDKLMQSGVERVFVLHDFDVNGFSIFGTLGKSSRRYRFENPATLVDLGLRLADVEAMRLDHEPSPNRSDEPNTWAKRTATLQQHGASQREIDFMHRDRVELNAMPSDVFIQFLERKLIEHGVHKVVPADDVLEQHARRVIERALINKALDKVRSQAETEAAAVALPDDLHQQVVAALEQQPAIPWDLAVADIAAQVLADHAP